MKLIKLNITFHENPFSGYQVISHILTDRAGLIGALYNCKFTENMRHANDLKLVAE